MPKKSFELLKIETKDPSEVFELHRCAISKAIINAISYGISSKKKKVDFAQVLINNMLVVTLSVDNKEFLSLIDDNLKILIEFEEYETCALAIKLKNKLNEKSNKKTRMVV